MLSPPDDLSEETLASVMEHGWGVRVASTAYRPVGFGSHHWKIIDAGGLRWFVTVDDLENKRHSRREPLDTAFDRLRASLAAATALRGQGYSFAVAPIATLGGEPLARGGDRFGVALYPFVDGRSFAWAEFFTPAHRYALLDFVIAVHTAPSAVGRHASADDFAVPHRDGWRRAWTAPPTSVPAARTRAPAHRCSSRTRRPSGGCWPATTSSSRRTAPGGPERS
jgi:hypothetical protein